MTNYYLDIETTGLNPEVDKIITIQLQKLEMSTGKPLGDLIILKEWESSEEDIVKKFLELIGVAVKDPFNFVATGFNLGFENKFLKAKSIKYGFPVFDINDKPSIDLKNIGVIMNQGQFKGASLDKLTGKNGKGIQVLRYYADKEYDKIIAYIEQETKEFLKFNTMLYQEMPKLLEEFKKTLNSV